MCLWFVQLTLKTLKINRYASKPLNIDDDGNAKKPHSLRNHYHFFFSVTKCHFSFHNQMISKLRICKSYRQWQSIYIAFNFAKRSIFSHSRQSNQFSIWTRVSAHQTNIIIVLTPKNISIWSHWTSDNFFYFGWRSYIVCVCVCLAVGVKTKTNNSMPGERN